MGFWHAVAGRTARVALWRLPGRTNRKKGGLAARGRGGRGVEPLEARLLLSGAPTGAAGLSELPLQITEFMASNGTSLTDAAGLTPDWIELHNRSDALVRLDGWTLTDDPEQPDKWPLPDIYLEPGAYWVVFASGRDSVQENVLLARDFHGTKDATFLVDLPEGTYDVRITLGDAMRVRDEMAVFLQGTQVDTVTAPAGPPAVRTYRAEVTSGDMGRLALRVMDQGGQTGNVAISALRIVPADGSPPLRFDFGTADSPVAEGYVRVAPTDRYGDASYGWQAGDQIAAKDRGGEPRRPHTNFKLSAAGDYLALRAPDGRIASEFGAGGQDYPRQVSDISYGLMPQEDASLSGVVGYFTTPTPGAPNLAASAIVGPRIRDVTELPGPLDDDQDLVITAQVSAALAPVASVSLAYRVMFGDETTVPMVDDGTGRDELAGDGIYTAVIPHTASAPGDMVRWAVAAVDTLGHGSRAPLSSGIQFSSGQFAFAADFSAGADQGFQAVAGSWSVVDGRYVATPSPAGDTVAVLPDLDALSDRYAVDLVLNIAPDSPYDKNAAFIFDYRGPTDFKFVLFNASAQRWQFGGRDASGWNVLMERASTTPIDADMAITIRIHGSVVQVIARGLVRASYDYGARLGDGLVGIGSNNSQVRFSHFAIDPGGLSDLDAPRYFGTVVHDRSIVTRLPLLEWFVENPRAAERRIGTRASVFYAGQFYDNIFVRTRGGTSQAWPKKSYKMQFNPGYRFRFREDQPRVREINVNSPFTDKAYTRATLAYELQRDAGTPSPETFPLRMQQNGEFYSVALFVEQPDEAFLTRSGLDPLGAFYKAGPGSRYDAGTRSFAKKTRQYEDSSDLQEFIEGLASEGESLESFLFDNVDIPAQINFMATNVVTQNIDASDKNHFVYRDSRGTGEWHMMPWDLDLTFGPDALNTDTILSDERTEGASNPNAVHPLLGGREVTLHAGKYNDFLDRMIKNPRTREMLLRRIRTLTDEFLASRYFYDRIDQLVDQLGPDVLLDKQRWGADAHFGATDFTLIDANERIKREYLDRRVRYLTEVQGPGGVGIPAAQPRRVQLDFGQDFEMAPAGGDPRQAYFTLVNPNAYAVDISGWEITGPVHTQFSAGTVIPAGEMLYLAADVRAFRERSASPTGKEGRFVQPFAGRMPSRGGTLSLRDATGRLVGRQAYPGSGIPGLEDLRITEIHYRPSDARPERGELDVDNDQFEFIELMNTGEGRLDLEGVRLVEVSVGGQQQGVRFTFDARTLDPGARVVLVRDLTAFRSRYGERPVVVGQYAGKLSNGGETLRLIDAAGGELIRFAYSDAAPWPAGADGGGASLEIIDAAGDPGDPGNWQASLRPGGSPGEANSIVLSGDMNRDGLVSQADATDFARALEAPDAFSAQRGVPAHVAGDLDGDGDLDFDDIAQLVALLAVDQNQRPR